MADHRNVNDEWTVRNINDECPRAGIILIDIDEWGCLIMKPSMIWNLTNWGQSLSYKSSGEEIRSTLRKMMKRLNQTIFILVGYLETKRKPIILTMHMRWNHVQAFSVYILKKKVMELSQEYILGR